MFIGKEKFSVKSKMAMNLLNMNSELKDAQERKQWQHWRDGLKIQKIRQA